MIPLRADARAEPVRTGRQVQAALRFRPGPSGSYLSHQHTPHPFHITRPFRMAGDPDGMATLYLQSSSGGLYGDDNVALALDVEAEAAAHITTQASTVVHHARGGVARSTVDISVGPRGFVEFLPDPAILFAGAYLAARVSLTLAENAQAIICDAVLHHDPEGAAAPFERWIAETDIHGPAGPVLRDRVDLDGADWRVRMGPWRCHATLIVAGPGAADTVAQLRSALAEGDGLWAGASAFEDRPIAIARILAADGAQLTAALHRAWAAARTALTGKPPCPRMK
ncbi:MAG: urease accessory protein UreD [Pseudomonadota bacterium]